MAELLSSERLQPSLLDRLTDDAPSEQQESREQRVLSVKRLRNGVLRDLGWLLNAVCLDSEESYWQGLDFAEHSVINFGILDLSGHNLSPSDIPSVERKIRQAIQDFEPRILPHTLKLKVIATDEFNHNAMNFDIEGDLWMQPVPLRLYLKTQVDLETGAVEITDKLG
jgi:type VI secretion system protein ImpF